jgi:hypothetical protein
VGIPEFAAVSGLRADLSTLVSAGIYSRRAGLVVAVRPPESERGCGDMSTDDEFDIFEVEGGNPRFSISLECAERWGVYNEIGASRYLEGLVRAEDPDLADRLEFDPEPDFMQINADSREDLMAVARIAQAASGPTSSG